MSLLKLDVQQNTLNATLAILSKTANCLRMGYIDIYVCEINNFLKIAEKVFSGLPVPF